MEVQRNNQGARGNDPDKHPVRTGLSFGFCCGAFLLYIASFVVFLYAKSRMEQIKDNFSNIVGNWQNDLIFEILNTSNIENKHNTYISTWAGYFPGTFDGCYCFTSSYYMNVQVGLHERQCNYNETWVGCANLIARPPQTLNRWIDDQEISVLKIRGTSFLDTFDKIKEDGTCVDGYIHCGNKLSKSKGVCIPKTIGRCPVTEIQSIKGDGLTEVKLGKYSLYYGSNSSLNPISDVNITESHLCLSRTDFPVTPGRPRYPLLQGYHENCQIDKEAISMMSMGEREFFDLNNVRYQGLIEYDVGNSYAYHLMAGRPVEWAPKCAGLVPDMMENSQKSQDVYSQYKILMVLFIISLIGVIVCCFFMFAVIIPGNDAKSSWIVFFITLIFYAMVFPSFAIISLGADDMSSDLKKVVAFNCSTAYTQENLIDLDNRFYDKVIYKNQWWIWLGVSSFLCLFFAAVFATWARKGENSPPPQAGRNYENAALLGPEPNN